RAQWKINQPPSLRGDERAWRGHGLLESGASPSPRLSKDEPIDESVSTAVFRLKTKSLQPIYLSRYDE
ncbi:MAG: hypothetical protein Q8S75_16870, partial [Nitrospirota bacterium]|nr:hypothetical protein [Nitrospirota bacterium]